MGGAQRYPSMPVRWRWVSLRSTHPTGLKTKSDLQLTPRHAPIRFEIPLARRIHHAVGQRRGRRVAVPAAGATLGIEIVAQRLLVEGGLRPAGLVAVGGPEPRTVRGHYLGDQDHAAVRRAAEL